MAAEDNKLKRPNEVILQNRHMLTVSGVKDVDSFDAQSIVAYTDYGALSIKGEGLHMSRLSTDSGELNIQGDIVSLCYEESPERGGFFARLFR